MCDYLLFIIVPTVEEYSIHHERRMSFSSDLSHFIGMSKEKDFVDMGRVVSSMIE